MAANPPPHYAAGEIGRWLAILTVGAIAVVLQASLTSSPSVRPAYQAEMPGMPRKPAAVHVDAAAARALRSSGEASDPSAGATRMDTAAAPGAHQYGTQGWHDVRRAGEGAAGEGAAGKEAAGKEAAGEEAEGEGAAGEEAEGEGAEGEGAAHSEAREDAPRSSGRSSRRPPSPGTQDPASPGTQSDPAGDTAESEPEEVGEIETEEIEPAVRDALDAYRLVAREAKQDAAKQDAAPGHEEAPRPTAQHSEPPAPIALDGAALEALLQLAGAAARSTSSLDRQCRARLQCLLRARLAAPGGSRRPGREVGPLGAQPATALGARGQPPPKSPMSPSACHHAGANPSQREARGHAAALRALGYTHVSATVLQAALHRSPSEHPTHPSYPSYQSTPPTPPTCLWTHPSCLREHPLAYPTL